MECIGLLHLYFCLLSLWLALFACVAETCIETCIGSMKRSLFSVVGDVGRCPKMASRGQQGQDNAGGVF